GGVGQRVADVVAQLGQHRLVVPQAAADEVLHGLAWPVGLVGNRLGGFPLVVTELARDHERGQFALLLAVEQGRVALQETRQAVAATGDEAGGEGGVGEQRLRLGVLKDTGHKQPSRAAPRSNYPAGGYVTRKKGSSRT